MGTSPRSAETNEEEDRDMYLTMRQRQILDFIRGHIARRGYAPSLEEIGKRFGLSSPATVHKHVRNLEEKGVIHRGKNRSRSIELVREREPETGSGGVELPLLGLIAAGAPIEAIPQDGTMTVPEAFAGKGNTYMLRVRGDSMIGDGILDGDYIVVEKRDTADDGETVVALLGNEEATLKKFHRGVGGTVRLVPANPELRPIVVPARDVTIQGVVVAVLRKYR